MSVFPPHKALNVHAAGNLDPLAVDPAIILGEQRRDHQADILRLEDAAAHHQVRNQIAELQIRANDTVPFEEEDSFGEGGTPTGNVVSVEQEMIKLSDTQIQYQTATNLYSKAVNMFRTALGSHAG